MPTIYRRYHIQLDATKDVDVIAYLDEQENVTDTIRQAIRREIESQP
jgi:hypothetical protein